MQNGAAVLAIQVARLDRGGDQWSHSRRFQLRGGDSGGGCLPSVRRRSRGDRGRRSREPPTPGKWRHRRERFHRLRVFRHAERGVEGARQSGRLSRLGRRPRGHARPGGRRWGGSGTEKIRTCFYANDLFNYSHRVRCIFLMSGQSSRILVKEFSLVARLKESFYQMLHATASLKSPLNETNCRRSSSGLPDPSPGAAPQGLPRRRLLHRRPEPCRESGRLRWPWRRPPRTRRASR